MSTLLAQFNLSCTYVENAPNYWATFYQKGSYVITPVHPLVHWSVFKYLKDHSLVFLIFCMKLGYHKGTIVTEPDFRKKSWGVKNLGKPPFWEYF